MSLMGTLAKVAVGIAVAKGASSMMKKSQGAKSDGGLFGGEHSPGRQASSGTGLEDMLGDLLGGKGQQGGGLGGMLEELQGSGQSRGRGLDDVLQQSGGADSGLGGLLESLTGGQNAAGGAGGLGGLLGQLAKAAGAGAGAGNGGNFGEVMNDAFARRGEPKIQPSRDQEAAAALMLRAMIQAAKSDGKIDENERAKLLDKLGDVSPEERDFVNRELAGPIDVAGLAQQTPQGLQAQVYAMSVMGIDLDNQNEAKYLHQLATEFGLTPGTVNQIHDKFGVPRLYS